jgi:hypothetical protein
MHATGLELVTARSKPREIRLLGWEAKKELQLKQYHNSDEITKERTKVQRG